MGTCVRCGCETQYMTAGSVCSACRHEEEVQRNNELFRQAEKEKKRNAENAKITGGNK